MGTPNTWSDHKINSKILSDYCKLDIVISTADEIVNKTAKLPVLMEVTS
jgi:hypothetical protein